MKMFSLAEMSLFSVSCAMVALCGTVAAAQSEVEDAAPVGRLGVGFFYEAEGGPGVEFDLHTRTLFGYPIEAEASFSTAQRERSGRVATGFDLAFAPSWGIGFEIIGLQSEPRAVSFEYVALGGAVVIGRELSPGLRFSSHFRQLNSRIGRLNTNQPSLIDEEGAGWQIDRSMGFSLRFRSSQEVFDELPWFSAGFSLDYSGLGGDREYLRGHTQLALRQGLMGGWLRIRAGLELAGMHMQSGSSRISERFHLGEYMRGFRRYGAGPRDATATGNDVLGGNFLAVARFDSEVPLTRAPDNRLFGGVFMDVGSVWGLDDSRAAGGGVVDDRLRWRAVAGINLGWDTGMGRLNLTLADAVLRRDGDKVMNVNVSFSTRF